MIRTQAQTTGAPDHAANRLAVDDALRRPWVTREEGLLLGATLHGTPGTLLVLGENHRAILGDGDRVLIVRGRLAVTRHDGPPVRERHALVGAEGDHGLDGDDHASLEADAPPPLAVVADLGVLVHHATDAVADVVAYDAVPVGLGKLLHRSPDVAEVIARDGLLDARLEAVARALAQRAVLLARLADIERPGVVTDPTLIGRPGVDGDDVPVLENRRGRGDAVNDLLVDGGADARGEAAIPLEGGNGAMEANEALHDLVDLLGGNAGSNQRPGTAKGRLGQSPGGLHLLDLNG